jgi:CheY-like chemotaxis protein
MKILLLEDDLLTLEAVAMFLRSHNLEVKTATSINRAVQCLADWVPDLITTDVGLDDKDAFAFLDMLEKSVHTSQIPVIAVSGYMLGNIQRKRFKAYLTKPVQLPELLRLIMKIGNDGPSIPGLPEQ